MVHLYVWRMHKRREKKNDTIETKEKNQNDVITPA